MFLADASSKDIAFIVITSVIMVSFSVIAPFLIRKGSDRLVSRAMILWGAVILLSILFVISKYITNH